MTRNFPGCMLCSRKRPKRDPFDVPCKAFSRRVCNMRKVSYRDCFCKLTTCRGKRAQKKQHRPAVLPDLNLGQNKIRKQFIRVNKSQFSFNLEDNGMETNDLCAWGSSAAPATVNPRGAGCIYAFNCPVIGFVGHRSCKNIPQKCRLKTIILLPGGESPRNRILLR